MLDYDNSASYYFALTMLMLYVLPGLRYFFKEIYYAFISRGIKPRVATEKQKMHKINNDKNGITRLYTTSFILNFIGLIIAISFMFYLFYLIKNDGEVNVFDPYQILGLQPGADVKDIKREYRKLSLKWHPDKNIGNKNAEDIFMKIAKAYEALTDETSKENYEKYGNPDGKQGLDVSIGLPSWILDYPKAVLVFYLIVMVIVIPTIVANVYNKSKKTLGEKNIQKETYIRFFKELRAEDKVINMPENLSYSAELREIVSTHMEKFTADDNNELTLLYNEIKSKPKIAKPKYPWDTNQEGGLSLIRVAVLLLHAYVFHINIKSGKLQKCLDDILCALPESIDALIDISLEHHRSGGGSTKYIETIRQIIQFSQLVIQQLWVTNSPYHQVPYVLEKKCQVPKDMPFTEFLSNPTDALKEMKELTPADIVEIKKALELIPNITYKTSLFVQDEEDDDDEEVVVGAAAAATQDSNSSTSNSVISSNSNSMPSGKDIYEEDLTTLRVILTHENIKSIGATSKKGGKEALPPIYSPGMPRLLQENWWFVLSSKDKNGNDVGLHAIEKCPVTTKEVTHNLRFMAPRQAGDYRFELNILCDCYVGVDITIPITFTVKPKSELPEYKPHPDDVKLDNEQTLFEQLLAPPVEDSSDDDSDDDDEDDEDEKILLNNPKAVNKPANDDDDDDDDE